MSTENVHEDHPWFKLPRWKKRLHGWASYQMSAWVALFFQKRLMSLCITISKNSSKNPLKILKETSSYENVDD